MYKNFYIMYIYIHLYTFHVGSLHGHFCQLGSPVTKCRHTKRRPGTFRPSAMPCKSKRLGPLNRPKKKDPLLAVLQETMWSNSVIQLQWFFDSPC